MIQFSAEDYYTCDIKPFLYEIRHITKTANELASPGNYLICVNPSIKNSTILQIILFYFRLIHFHLYTSFRMIALKRFSGNFHWIFNGTMLTGLLSAFSSRLHSIAHTHKSIEAQWRSMWYVKGFRLTLFSLSSLQTFTINWTMNILISFRLFVSVQSFHFGFVGVISLYFFYTHTLFLSFVRLFFICFLWVFAKGRNLVFLSLRLDIYCKVLQKKIAFYIVIA